MVDTFSFQLDRTAKVSLVEQIRQSISTAIRNGVLAPGARLPSWRVLAVQLGVARGTVRKAYDLLTDARMIVSSGSAGTRVAALPVKRRGDDASVAAEARPTLTARGRDESHAMFEIGVPARDSFVTQVFARLRAATARQEATTTLYPDIRGDLAFRQEIAAHIAISRNIDCSIAQIFVTSGFSGALSLIMHVLRACGRTAWIEDPGLPDARQAMRIAGVSTVPVPVDDEGIDVDAGIRLAPDASMAMVTPAQQAPLGPTLSHARRLQLIEWAKRSGSWIIEDDSLGDLQLGARVAPALASLDPAGRVIHVGSFSKTISPNLRLGFVVVPPSLIPVFAEVASGLLPAPGPAAQRATAAFMQGGHYLRHLHRMKRVYAARRVALSEALKARGFQTREAALAILIDLPTAVDDIALVRAAAACNMAPTPLSAYFVLPRHARHGLLLGIADAPGERVDAACDRLCALVDSM